MTETIYVEPNLCWLYVSIFISPLIVAFVHWCLPHTKTPTSKHFLRAVSFATFAYLLVLLVTAFVKIPVQETTKTRVIVPNNVDVMATAAFEMEYPSTNVTVELIHGEQRMNIREKTDQVIIKTKDGHKLDDLAVNRGNHKVVVNVTKITHTEKTYSADGILNYFTPPQESVDVVELDATLSEIASELNKTPVELEELYH